MSVVLTDDQAALNVEQLETIEFDEWFFDWWVGRQERVELCGGF